jgi:hypothetical protein
MAFVQVLLFVPFHCGAPCSHVFFIDLFPCNNGEYILVTFQDAWQVDCLNPWILQSILLLSNLIVWLVIILQTEKNFPSGFEDTDSLSFSFSITFENSDTMLTLTWTSVCIVFISMFQFHDKIHWYIFQASWVCF